MLEYGDEILLEEYITSQFMSCSERDKCISYLMNIKDVNDSDLRVCEDDPSEYAINYMRLVKTVDGILFDGVVENDVETRWIDGTILFDGDKVVVTSHFYRTSILVDKDDSEYSCVDIFSFENDILNRRSEYLNTRKIFKDVISLSEDKLYDFYMKRIGKDIIKRTKKA